MENHTKICNAYYVWLLLHNKNILFLCYYEILQEAMEQGLRMNGLRAKLLDEEKIWSKMNEWINVTVD